MTDTAPTPPRTDDCSRARIEDTSTLVTGKLPITGTAPVTVYVQLFDENGKPVPGFGAAEQGTFYKGGISWQFTGTTPMFVTFVFGKGIASIDCDGLAYSPPYGESPVCQMLVIPQLYAEVHFTVKRDDGSQHDPKILIEPVLGKAPARSQA